MKTPGWILLLSAAGLAQAQTVPAAPAAPAATPPHAAPAAPAAPAQPALAAVPALPAGPGKVYAPGEFDRLELAGAARVLLVQGERNQAFVAGDEEVQQGIAVELHGRMLVIRPAGGWKFWHADKPFVQVEVRQLKQLSVSGASDVHVPGLLRADQLRLTISGSASVRAEQLEARQLTFGISGAGDGQLGGRVDELALQISGKGKVVADKLQAQKARVSVSGIGNVVVWVTEELTARISGIGSVDYFGSPHVLRSVSGMGTITAKGDKR
ncbi:head GIN domain-containing protein [Roseateles sp. DC23W]|uniref:Head GIN domain-containing protein n=1 Tax=Pelomonas dachongensis TaxID=3299029 RepID=A0ABW7EFR8_9BURK